MSGGGTSPAVTPERIQQAMWGYAAPIILGTAVRHRVFDLLDEAALTVEELSVRSGASVRGLRILLNALVGLQFLTKNAGHRYALTPESATFLVSTKPSYLGGLLRNAGLGSIQRWLALPEIVQNGRPEVAVNQEETGSGFLQELVAALFPANYPSAQMLGKTLGVPEASKPVRVLDLAAGSGVWGIGLAHLSPQVTVTAVDWPAMFAITRQYALRHGVAERFSYIPGDLAVVDFGSGYDIAILGPILHSEGARRSRELLRKTHGALAPGGTVAIAEMLVNEDRTGPAQSLLFAVNMLVHTEEGDTFSFKEICGWLADAGFVNPRLLEPRGPASIVVAERAA